MLISFACFRVWKGALARALLPLLFAGLVGGCAFAPGMYVGKSLQAGSPSSAAEGEAEDVPPPGALISITPELIRQQKGKRLNVSAPEVKKLFSTPKPYQIGPGDVLSIVVWDHPELMGSPNVASGGGGGFHVSSKGLIQFPYIGVVRLAGLTEYEARDLITQRLSKYFKSPQVTVRIQAYRSGSVYVDGEVRTPGLLNLNDIPMTLPEAIGRAGGFTPVADRSGIAITRQGKTTMVNMAGLIEQGINPSSILLASGDLVRVLGREESKVFVLGEVLRPNTQTLRNGRLTLNEALGESGGINQTTGDPRQIFVVRAAHTERPEIYHLDAHSPVAYALAEGFELQARDVIYVDPVPLVRWNRVISLILPSAQSITVTRAATSIQ